MIALILAVVVGILLIGLFLKIMKIALIVALCAGIFLLAQNALGAKRLK